MERIGARALCLQSLYIDLQALRLPLQWSSGDVTMNTNLYSCDETHQAKPWPPVGRGSASKIDQFDIQHIEPRPRAFNRYALTD